MSVGELAGIGGALLGLGGVTMLAAAFRGVALQRDPRMLTQAQRIAKAHGRAVRVAQAGLALACIGFGLLAGAALYALGSAVLS